MVATVENYSGIKTAKAMMNNSRNMNTISSVQDMESKFLTAGKVLFERNLSGISDPIILNGSYGDKEISITVSQLQGIVSLLHDELNDLGIQKGTNIMLVSFPASSELFRAIYFISLITMGARVFMPRKCNVDELQDWISKTNMQYALIPGMELLRHEMHEEENAAMLEMNDVFISRHISLLDTISSFPLERIILSGEYATMSGNGGQSQAYRNVSPGDEALIMAFPGTNGNSALKVYTQEEVIKQALDLKLPISILFRPMEGDEPLSRKSIPSHL
jgi:hypothetical protein